MERITRVISLVDGDARLADAVQLRSHSVAPMRAVTGTDLVVIQRPVEVTDLDIQKLEFCRDRALG